MISWNHPSLSLPLFRAAFCRKPRTLFGAALYGSAPFFEFGDLSPAVKHDGSPGNPCGECSIMLEWSWRIEQGNAILCGSWSDDDQWETHFASLVGLTVKDVSLFGRLPELYVSLSGGFYIASFMTAEDQPCWAIFRRDGDNPQPRWLTVEDGLICEQGR